ncbi:MAG: alpha/beta fold hydrolase [Alphaproteobacteria bacterium]|nr:alpha/beta fold hydrolase [Alphaproteobacteria bacterium]
MTSFPGWPAATFVQTNGIRMAVHEAGPADAKPALVLCHGFPELAFSWRHQVRDLAAMGFRVLAPDQRGYGLTDAPAPVESYDIEHLCGDLIGLLDAKAIDKAVFVGHDWGGIVVWQMGLRHPERCAGIIGVNTPFMPRLPIDPIAIMRERMGPEMYIVHFQKPGEADAALGADVAKSMSFFMRKTDPAMMPASAGLATQRQGDESIFPLVRMVEAYDPAGDPRPSILTEAEMAFFVDTFKRTGFTGGINWYRNFTRNWERSADLATQVTLPSLMIMAEHDMVLPPSAADGMEQWVPNLEKRLIRNSGHWTQQEQPAETTRAIAEWVRKTFG